MEVLWNTELLFQTVHAVNQLSVYAAVIDWCYQFCFTNEEKEQVAVLVDNGILTMVDQQKWTCLYFIRTWHLET